MRQLRLPPTGTLEPPAPAPRVPPGLHRDEYEALFRQYRAEVMAAAKLKGAPVNRKQFVRAVKRYLAKGDRTPWAWTSAASMVAGLVRRARTKDGVTDALSLGNPHHGRSHR